MEFCFVATDAEASKTYDMHEETELWGKDEDEDEDAHEGEGGEDRPH